MADVFTYIQLGFLRYASSRLDVPEGKMRDLWSQFCASLQFEDMTFDYKPVPVQPNVELPTETTDTGVSAVHNTEEQTVVAEEQVESSLQAVSVPAVSHVPATVPIKKVAAKTKLTRHPRIKKISYEKNTGFVFNSRRQVIGTLISVDVDEFGPITEEVINICRERKWEYIM